MSPTLSYCDPGTPSPFIDMDVTWPHSPVNPFLVPNINTNGIFRKPSLLILASPLSVFDQALSPTSSTTRQTFLLPPSPMPSPSFLFPRIPPPCPGDKIDTSLSGVIADASERKGSVISIARMRQVMRLEFYQFLFLKKQQEIDMLEGLAREKEPRKRCDSSIACCKIKGLLCISLFDDKTRKIRKAGKSREEIPWRKAFQATQAS
ncbi:hypothetical protein COCCADRAFT_26732 [Bipolaris zeicola 26-R-13]|uniref:Uncharacterized protein n=1 Tax=Cochliobolus carbonum (strain 26-R-13) TaxID=930089 RepID=W6Y4N1_COCC2|nr:uncharacterized protein COCCADRAFT_26732 [Bipolaris zeicola 26-R-13]EUC32843.1 hypothetical protein COCCADRAFT_26732 [Bipolaris zeicola 26-R-13]